MSANPNRPTLAHDDANTESDNDGDAEPVLPPSAPGMGPGARASLSAWRGIGPVLLLVILVNLSRSLYQLPLNRVIERRICREYYLEHDPSVLDPDGNVEEGLCKGDEIQQGLGWIQGVMETTWIAGGELAEAPILTRHPAWIAKGS